MEPLLASDVEVRANGVLVYGNGNAILGHDCVVRGNYNIDKGERNEFHGIGNARELGSRKRKRKKMRKDRLEQDDRRFARELRDRELARRGPEPGFLSMVLQVLSSSSSSSSSADLPPLALPTQEQADAEPVFDSISEDRMCQLCCEKEKSTTIIDCGHKVTCAQCILTLLQRDDSRRRCPMCRTDIKYGAKIIKEFG